MKIKHNAKAILSSKDRTRHSSQARITAQVTAEWETFLATLQICIYINWNQAAVPAGNTHRANAQCRRYDTKKNRVLHSVVHVSLPFISRSVLVVVLVNVPNRLLKLTISGAIVTTLILFLVAAVATRRRRRWRLHHPFRNIGQQIYHCNWSDYAFVSR